MASPDRLEALKKIPREIKPELDKIMNRNTLLIYGGMFGYIGLNLAEVILHSNGVDFGLPRVATRLIVTLPSAYPIFKGVIGNTREYLSPSRVLNLADSPRDIMRMGTAGLSLHSAGEYAQILAAALGGADFVASWKTTDLQKFLFDPHNIPYWTLNIPSFFLIGKSGVSMMKRGVNSVIETIQLVRSLKYHKPDPLEPKQ